MDNLEAVYNTIRGTQDVSFIALRGKEGASYSYTVNATYEQLIENFKLVPFDPDSKLLIQRETQKSRINNISNYLTDTHASFPSAGSIVEKIEAEKIMDNVYKITIKADSFKYFFDGQGRFGGVAKFLSTNNASANDTLTIKFYESQGYKLDNQRFSDWNGASVRPNKSICQAMDSRLVINDYAKTIISESPFISERIDFTKASVTGSSKSENLWSLNQFVTFVQMITGVTAKSAEDLFANKERRNYWQGFINKYISLLNEHPQIGNALNGDTSAPATREKTIIGTSVWLKSIALTGKVIALHLTELAEPIANWSFFEKLNTVDFSRDNPEWLGRCMNYRGKYEDKAFNHKAMCVYLLSVMELPIPDSLIDIENTVAESRVVENHEFITANQQQLPFETTQEKAA